jgi:hypothetical protein
MSADYHVSVVYGVKFDRKLHTYKKKNPSFNPDAPFDPKTGRRVEEYIEIGILKEHVIKVAEIHGLDYRADTDEELLFIGICSKSVDLNECTHVKLNMDNVGDIKTTMRRFCSDSGVPFDTLGYYAVGYCSY